MDASAADPDITPWTILDISSEEYRTYTYTDGKKFRVNRPVTLYLLNGGGHRIVDKDGVTHRPERGYLGISWKPKDGQPPFIA